MPPSQIIDSDCETAAAYYALEYSTLWREDNPGAEGRTWTEVLNATVLSAIGLGGVNLQFSRVRIVGGKLYVVAAGGGENTRDLYILRSANGGLTWSWTFIDSAVVAIKPYTITNGAIVSSVEADRVSVPIGSKPADAIPYLICERKDQAGFDTGLGGPNGSWGIPMPLPAENYINQFGTGAAAGVTDVVNAWRNNILGDGNDALYNMLNGWMTAEFGGPNTVHGTPGGWERYSWDTGHPMLDTGNYIGFQNNSNIQPVNWEWWIFWNAPEPLQGLGFDVAPTNTNWLYIGTENAVLKSEDGGYTWAAIITDRGADDIKVHPTAAGVFSFWATDGNLYQAVNGVVQAMLMYGSRAKVPLRIAQSPSGGELYVLACSGGDLFELKKRNGGQWTTLIAPIAHARAVRFYYKTSAGVVLFLSGSDIAYSVNGGSAFSYKKGGWSAYSSPVNIHLL